MTHKLTNFPGGIGTGVLQADEVITEKITATTQFAGVLQADEVITEKITATTQFAVADGGTFKIGPLYLEITPVADGENPVLSMNTEVGTLVGVLCFAAATGIITSITGAAVDDEDATKINITGTPGEGWALVLYTEPVSA